MSSVQSFIRQIPLATTYYTCASGTPLYTFVPTAANQFPGNYPNGVGYCVSGTFFTSANVSAGCYLRDMGKTIKCPLGVPTPTSTQYFWREVQVLFPNQSQNSLSTFGVLGNPTTPSVSGNPSAYYTFYVPVPVGGSDIPTASLTFPLQPIAGGQM